MFVGCYRIGRRPNMSINDACGDAGGNEDMEYVDRIGRSATE